ncbi:uncharacterized protein LOC132950917 isoform X1 [Metopolophium dirhodum]|uniref:uncharacterized protein LOC132950917 isoform X1 n=2 Tax=Metopolophium dirhodum TaxID=44670 RepID=UPI00298F5106|nr:uncharacterized protein LOC132950917 isoform X1 [Metopolophium dirhodum]
MENKLSTEMNGENNNNIMDSIDFSSDSDSLLDTYYYGCLSSDESSDDVSQLIPTNNNVPVTIINQDLWCIDDSGSEHYDSDKDPEYIPQLDNFNLVDEALVYNGPVTDNYDLDVNNVVNNNNIITKKKTCNDT